MLVGPLAYVERHVSTCSINLHLAVTYLFTLSMHFQLSINKYGINIFKTLGIITGNPGVFQGYPDPYPTKPVPTPKGKGYCGLG